MAKIEDRVDKMIDSFKKSHSEMTQEQVNALYQSSLSLYLSLAYPFDKSRVCLTSKDYRAVPIIKMIMDELLSRQENGLLGVKSYSENGMSFSFDSSSISDGLKDMIVPKVGVI